MLRPHIERMMETRMRDRAHTCRLMAQHRPACLLELLSRVTAPASPQDSGRRDSMARVPLHSSLADVGVSSDGALQAGMQFVQPGNRSTAVTCRGARVH